ncbi:PREDICTED: uncharacterized protein LOC104601654 [Nelumbo nucifera]|uniref:Uncharacterized protein n=2 Tax=Nelumbo nucifera TaxID=4432 RepID=A0A822ZWD8_NELNU|nr:PREDICTED: uncharacterized protein LOC104601654 [Nelumbo nucifera]DAD46238.1 TPA_asm: hypothetical protein HUJ06_004468 [Nelumbo nucifera]
MEPTNPSMNSGDARIDVEFPSRHVSFSDQPNKPDTAPATVPLLPQPAYARSKSSIYDELRNFRISLKWCALDHSSCTGKFVSYLAFVLLTVIIPIASSLSVRLPPTASADDPISFNKLVQFPESGHAAIAFFTLSGFFRRYGLRQLLFLDAMQDDSPFVRRGYARELDKAFRHLAFILLPSFFVEFFHKIIFFSTVTVSIPYISASVPSNSIMFIAVLASWVYRTGVFLLVCVLFRLTCELQILRFEGFHKLLEGCGSESDSCVIFREHMRIRKQLSVTSHRYRSFIIGCLVTITVSQLGALMLALASKSEKSFFNSGDVVVCSAVQLSGFFLCLLGAARITHRAQGIVSIATRWHIVVTCASCNAAESEAWKNLLPIANADPSDDHSSHTLASIPSSQDTSSFQTRQALVTYLQHNNGGITLFGFALDRGLLHTLFAFEFSLVLWILSKAVVLS